MVSSITFSRFLSRRPVRIGLIALLILALLGLLVFYSPRFLVRYLLADQLDALHIDHSGVETLIINPFTGELSFGPVQIAGKDNEAARLDSLGLSLGYNQLLDRRIFIERLILQGIDLHLVQDDQQHYILNGIPLDTLLPGPDQKTEPEPEQNAEPWKPGLAVLELRNSRVLFQDRTRGELSVDVDRLQLMNFLDWQPDKPGQFELTARVNDIQLNWSGEATPFANDIGLSIDSTTEQLDLPKIVRFIGSLGLDRRDGVYKARLKHRLTLLHDGGIKGHSQGVIEGKTVDYLRQDHFALTLDRIKADLDVDYAWKTAGDFSLQGKLALDLGPSNIDIENRTKVALTSGRVKMAKLHTDYAPNGSLQLAMSPTLDLEQVDFSGPIEISVDKLLDLLAVIQSLSSGSQATAKDTGLGDFAGGSVTVPSSDVKIGRVQSQGDSFSLESSNGLLNLALKTHSQLSDISVASKAGEIKVEHLQSDLEDLQLVSGHGALNIEFVGNNALKSGQAHSPNGELKIDSLENTLSQFALQVNTGAIGLKLAGENRAAGFSGLIYAKEALPEVDIRLGQFSSKVEQAALDQQEENLQWRVSADSSADELLVEFAKGKESKVKFDHTEIQGLQADERLQLVADVLSLNGLDLTLKRSLLEALTKGGEGKDESTATEQPPEINDLKRAQTLLGQLGFDPGVVDGRMGPQTEAAIKAFQKQEGVSVDGQMSAGLLAQLELRASGAEPGSAGPGLRIGRFTLGGNPVIRFHDDIVDPPVKINTMLKECQVLNLSTKARKDPSDISLAAVINEFTQVELKGWIRGLHQTADLDLELRLKNLELSTYSPYVTQLAGVNMEAGQLNTQVNGKAKAGVLQGKIKLDLDHMEFSPLSEAEAAKVTEAVGVPLGLAVSLLEDGDGRIALNLPLSGILSKPDVDISSAVNKAIGGALKRVFPPTLAVSLLSKIGEVGRPSFDPVEFAPGSAELDATGRLYVDKIADFLTDHPKLSLKLCGRSTPQDLAQLTEAVKTEQVSKPAPEQPQQTADNKDTQGGQTELPAVSEETLKELALARKDAVRAYLIGDKGISAERVPECRSRYLADDTGNPRVVITF